MTLLKWFAGGSERRCEALAIIDYLLEDIKDAPQLTLLKNQLWAIYFLRKVILFENQIQTTSASPCRIYVTDFVSSICNLKAVL